ncbi:hypothetical protein MRX96_050224 [Rhipicephalus microplus]
MLFAIEAGRHRPAFFSASTAGRRRPGGAIAFPLLTLLELRHTFRHFRHPVRAFQFFLIGIFVIVPPIGIVIVPPQTLYEPTPGASNADPTASALGRTVELARRTT